jgi:hypothetical protein
MNKRGASTYEPFGQLAKAAVWLIVVVTLLIIVFILVGTDTKVNEAWDRFKGGTSMGFEEAWAGAEGNRDGFKFMNYIFGKIPEFLLNWAGENTNIMGPVPPGANDGARISASIIVIALWLMFFLTFGEIIYMFSIFDRPVGFLIGALLTIILANVGIMKNFAALMLAVTAIFGAVSVLGAIFFTFVLFILFMFGSRNMRRYLLIRKAEDHAMKAIAGGKKAASAVSVLKEVAEAAEHG